MCPYIPPGITAAARRLSPESRVRTFSAMSVTLSLPFRSDELTCDRLDSCRVEPVTVVEGGGRADDDVLVGHAVPAERDADACLCERLRHRRAQPSGDVVLLDGE